MKLFEEFENALRGVNSVKGLTKLMRANSVEAITVLESGIVIELNAYGFVDNVPMDKWELVKYKDWESRFEANFGICNVFCNFNTTNTKELFERVGYVFPVGDTNETK